MRGVIAISFLTVSILLQSSIVTCWTLNPLHLPRLASSAMIDTVVSQQYASEAVALFNNMKTPTTLLIGAMVPIGLLQPLESKPPENGRRENRLERTIRRAYPLVAILSLLSELVSVIWATVAVNKLTETAIAPASSVWDLLQRDFDLPWSAVNAHFFMGMLGFAFMIGTKAYFQSNGGLIGQSIASVVMSGLLLMISIVNRGVARGSGDGMRYGSSVLHLIGHYCVKLFKQATNRNNFGLFESMAISLLVFSSIQGVRALISREDEGK